ncbi:MAG: hypothetical protein ACP5NM_13410, partial [Thiomonas sp.]
MASAKNLAWMRASGRRYIIGAPKSELKHCQAALAEPAGWRVIREGVEVKLLDGTVPEERFILCRSADRRAKERAMHEKFSTRIEAALARLQERIARAKKPLDKAQVSRQIGRLLQRNSRAAARFETVLQDDDSPAGFTLRVQQSAEFDRRAAMSEG